jgi:hypothetical protein
MTKMAARSDALSFRGQAVGLGLAALLAATTSLAWARPAGAAPFIPTGSVSLDGGGVRVVIVESNGRVTDINGIRISGPVAAGARLRTEVRFANTFPSGAPSGRVNVGALTDTLDALFDTCSDCARMLNPIRMAPLPNPFPVQPARPAVPLPDVSLPSPSVASGLWWSFSQGGRTLEFVADPDALVALGRTPRDRNNRPALGAGGIVVVGTGIFRLAGYADTPGEFAFTTQMVALASTTFSASFTVTPVFVPAPAALGVFGLAAAGLAAAGAARRRRAEPAA